jgi:hypothetical protein
MAEVLATNDLSVNASLINIYALWRTFIAQVIRQGQQDQSYTKS